MQQSQSSELPTFGKAFDFDAAVLQCRAKTIKNQITR